MAGQCGDSPPLHLRLFGAQKGALRAALTEICRCWDPLGSRASEGSGSTFVGGTRRDQQLECVHLKLPREIENQSV